MQWRVLRRGRGLVVTPRNRERGVGCSVGGGGVAGGSEAHPVLSRGAQSRTNELRLAY